MGLKNTDLRRETEDELIQAQRLKQEIELSSVLGEQDEYFCQLYLNGGSDFQGKLLACYKKAFSMTHNIAN